MNECVCLSECLALTKPRPIAEWHEDMGPQLWWCWEPPKPFKRISEYVVSSAHDGRWLGEAPYVGSPLDLGHTVESEMILRRHGEPELKKVFREQVGGWPGYHTHFTPLPPMPEVPK